MSIGIDLDVGMDLYRGKSIKLNKSVRLGDRTKVAGMVYVTKKNGEAIFHSKKFKDVVLQKKKEYPYHWVFTIRYYGTKKMWRKEYEVLYHYLHSLGCTKVIDCFGGSGFLSLLAAKTNLFEKIMLNELSYLAINYHYVLKNDSTKRKTHKLYQDLFKILYGDKDRERDLFQEFLFYLSELDEEKFNILKSRYDKLAYKEAEEKVKVFNKKKKVEEEKIITVLKPRRIQVREADVERAVIYFSLQHYRFRGNGNFDTQKSKAPKEYKIPLQQTHELYQKIELSQLYYKKVMLQYLDDASALILLDPPYLNETLVKKDGYICNFERRQHTNLLEELTEKVFPSKIILCGYSSYLYNHYFHLFNARHGVVWHNIRVLRLGKRKDEEKRVHEHIWVNFEISELVNKYPDMFEEVDIATEVKRLKKPSKEYKKRKVKNTENLEIESVNYQDKN